MTDQQLFDRVAEHLLKQNKRCTKYDECQYRAGKLTCAIGCLIPDSRYNKALEGRGVDTPEVRRAAHILVRQTELARDLQRVHDNFEPSKWIEELRSVAIDHKLLEPWPE
jgi:hypothetical protein